MRCRPEVAKDMLEELVNKTRLIAKIKYSEQEYYMRPSNVTSIEQVFWQVVGAARKRREADNSKSD